MRINDITNRIPIALLIAIVIIALCSWIGSIYETGLNNLFSADAIRWAAVNLVPNIGNAPYPTIILGLITLGALKESGLIYSFSSKASLKQNRALSFAILVFGILCLITAFMTLSPNGVLRNSFGEIRHSPFTKGLYGGICIVVLLVSNVYGISSGNFTNLSDTIKAHTSLLQKCQTYFISMILVSELMACLNYTNILTKTSTLYVILSWCLYLIPLILNLAANDKEAKK